MVREMYSYVVGAALGVDTQNWPSCRVQYDVGASPSCAATRRRLFSSRCVSLVAPVTLAPPLSRGGCSPGHFKIDFNGEPAEVVCQTLLLFPS